MPTRIEQNGAGAPTTGESITGQFLGTAGTFAGLPVVDALGDAYSNGDWAILTADDGVNDEGIYVFDGTDFVFAGEVAGSATSFASVNTVTSDFFDLTPVADYATTIYDTFGTTASIVTIVADTVSTELTEAGMVILRNNGTTTISPGPVAGVTYTGPSSVPPGALLYITYDDTGLLAYGALLGAEGDNLYTADGQLTANRVVDTDNRNLLFSGAGSFQVTRALALLPGYETDFELGAGIATIEVTSGSPTGMPGKLELDGNHVALTGGAAHDVGFKIDNSGETGTVGDAATHIVTHAVAGGTSSLAAGQVLTLLNPATGEVEYRPAVGNASIVEVTDDFTVDPTADASATSFHYTGVGGDTATLSFDTETPNALENAPVTIHNMGTGRLNVDTVGVAYTGPTVINGGQALRIEYDDAGTAAFGYLITGSVLGAATKTAKVRKGITDDNASDAAFMVVMGQSNAAGRDGTAVAAAANVHVMPRGTRAFAPYSNTDSNVAKSEGSDHINPLSSIAEEWQARIDGGADLPDLYIINISVGGRGLGATAPNNTWNPDLINSGGGVWPVAGTGVNDATNFSLYTLADEAIRAGVAELVNAGRRPVHLGTIWNQWESDSQSDAAVETYANEIRRVRSMVDAALNIEDASFICWRPSSHSAAFDANRPYMGEVIDDLSNSERNVYTIDPEQSPQYTGAGPQYGIFFDAVHYIGAVQTWAGQQVVADILDNDVIVGRTASIAPVATAAGIDDVLAVNQALTADRDIELDSFEVDYRQGGALIAGINPNGIGATRYSTIQDSSVVVAGANVLDGNQNIRFVAAADTAGDIQVSLPVGSLSDTIQTLTMLNAAPVARTFVFDDGFFDYAGRPLGGITVAVGEERMLKFHQLPSSQDMRVSFDSKSQHDNVQLAGRVFVDGAGWRNSYEEDDGYNGVAGDVLSYSMWYMPSTTQPNNTRSIFLLGVVGESQPTNSQFLIQKLANGTHIAGWEFGAGDNAFTVLTDFVPLFDRLNHIGVVQDIDAGTADIYLNGVFSQTITGTAHDGGDNPRLYVMSSPTLNRSTFGYMSHVTVWKEALTAEEMKRLAAKMSAFANPNPLEGRSSTYYNNFSNDHQELTSTGLYQISTWGTDIAAPVVGLPDVADLSSQFVKLSGVTTPGAESDLAGMTLTVPVSGEYLVSLYGHLRCVGDDCIVYAKATYGNNTALFRSVEVRHSTSDSSIAEDANSEVRFSAVQVLTLAAGDVIKVKGSTNASGTIQPDTSLTLRQLASSVTVDPADLTVEDVKVLLSSGTTANTASLSLLPFAWDQLVAQGYEGVEITAYESKTAGLGTVLVGTRYFDAELFSANAASGEIIESIAHISDSNYLWLRVADVTTSDGVLQAASSGGGDLHYKVQGVKPQKTVVDTDAVPFEYRDALPLNTSDITIGTSAGQYAIVRPKRRRIGNSVTLTYHFVNYWEDGIVAFTIPAADMAVINNLQMTRDAVGATATFGVVRTSDISFTLDRVDSLDGNSPFFLTIEGDAA